MIQPTSIIFIGLLAGFLLAGLSGCTSVGEPRRPVHLPAPPPPIDISRIPDAVPRFEPRSRYGNPESYVVFGRRYYTRTSNKGFVEQGIASWYGPDFHGKRASNGDTYDMYKMTAAHKTLSLPAYVEVTNLVNGKRITVRVNDRGPFHENRIIDLSYVAAAKLDLIKTGTGMVEIRVIDPANPLAHRLINRPKQTSVRPASRPSPRPAINNMYVQLGAFSERENALRLQNHIQQKLNRSVAVVTDQSQGQSLYKVRIGPILSVDTADQIVHELNGAGLYDHRVVFQ